jgi:hypothetical protein
MNAASDTLLNNAEEKSDTVRQEQKTQLDASLVELGKVSDTKGGFLGSKLDVGSGFISY